MTLASAFGCSTAPVQNNYAANQDYRLGYVQVWNIDIQRTLPMGIVTNIGYNGAWAASWICVRAPNRTATGAVELRDAQAFTYEDSLGYSRFKRVERECAEAAAEGRFAAGDLSVWTLDRQCIVDWRRRHARYRRRTIMDLAAEEGNSAFDVRHKVTGNWVLELPFGPNRAFLYEGWILVEGAGWVLAVG